MRVRRCFAGIVYDAVGMVLWLWVMMGVDVNPGWEGECVGDIMSMREGRLVGELRYLFFLKKRKEPKDGRIIIYLD